MLEIKVYSSVEVLLSEVKDWIRDEIPYDFRVIEGEDQTDYDNDGSVMDFIKEAITFNFSDWEKFVVVRREVGDNFSEDDEIVLAVLKYPKENEEKFMRMINKHKDEFILSRSNSVLVLDGRIGVINSIECILEDDKSKDYSSEVEEKFSNMSLEEKIHLYKKYVEYCKENNEKISDYSLNKSISCIRSYIKEGFEV